MGGFIYPPDVHGQFGLVCAVVASSSLSVVDVLFTYICNHCDDDSVSPLHKKDHQDDQTRRAPTQHQSKGLRNMNDIGLYLSVGIMAGNPSMAR
jgi:hypothetical protein